MKVYCGIRTGIKMTDTIKNILLQNGYAKILSSLPEITIFYQLQGTGVIVIQTIDYKQGITLTKEQYLHIKEQVFDLFRKKGITDIKFFSLFITKNVEEVRQINAHDPFSWIYDTESGRIVAYEEQVSDFYGLRGLLEQIYPSRVKEENSKIRTDASFITNNPAPMNTVLVLLNIIIFLGLEIFGSTTDLSYMVEKGAMFPPYLIERHQYYRLFTCMFMHFGYTHLAYNMLALYLLGEYVEFSFGKARYLLLYLLSGLGASFFSLVFALLKGNDVVSAGASGAVFGVIGALLYIVIYNKGRFYNITLPKLLLMIGYSIFSGLTSAGIDNAAHLGGLITGILLAVLLYRKKGDQIYEN